MFKYKLTLWTTATSHRQTDKHTPHTQANSLQRVLVGDWSVIRRCFFYSAPAGTPVAPPRSSLFLFHPSFVTVCQRERKKTKKQLRALKCLIHLPPLRLWSVCLFLLAGRSRSASDLFSDQHILAQFSLPLMFVCPFELVSFFSSLHPFLLHLHLPVFLSSPYPVNAHSSHVEQTDWVTHTLWSLSIGIPDVDWLWLR